MAEKKASVILLIFFNAFSLFAQPEKKAERPNFVFILADDLGYGDLSCYGSQNIQTPQLDELAQKGMRFTDFYATAPICSPTRAAFLTGRYPVRQGINHVFFPESWTGIDSSEYTLAEALKDSGYRTGLVGKWHLGHHYQFLPLQNGFQEYFGIPYSNDMQNAVYMRGNKVVEHDIDQSQITRCYTEEALSFIDKHHNRPFFLYLAHSMPHFPVYASGEFKGKSKDGIYGDAVQELDWSVGQIVKKLKDLGIDENTLLIFTSDNGPWLAVKPDAGSAGILREGKQTTFEGGMRVPAIACWPGKIRPGSVDGTVSNTMDFYTTFIKLAGAEIKKDRVVDGLDISPVLLGKGKRANQDLYYFSLGELQALRSGAWKLKLPYTGNAGGPSTKALPPHPLLLFNLLDDPGEQKNLAEKYPERVKKMLEKMKNFKKSLGPLPPSKIVQRPADKSYSDKRKK